MSISGVYGLFKARKYATLQQMYRNNQLTDDVIDVLWESFIRSSNTELVKISLCIGFDPNIRISGMLAVKYMTRHDSKMCDLLIQNGASLPHSWLPSNYMYRRMYWLKRKIRILYIFKRRRIPTMFHLDRFLVYALGVVLYAERYG